jgi:hypothetical protein
VAKKRDVAFTVRTPFPAAPEVVCYQDTWDIHIPAVRRVPDAQQIVMTTLSQPSVIVAGTTNPGYVAFVNQAQLSPNSGNPFVVFVDPEGKPIPAVASIGPRRDFRDLSQHTIIWSPPLKK